MKASFSNAEHLLCFIHAKDNIVKKCASLGIEPKIYLNEMFGVKVGETKIKGLLDCTSKKYFEKQYQKLKKIWETRPNGNKFGGEGGAFVDSFSSNPTDLRERSISEAVHF